MFMKKQDYIFILCAVLFFLPFFLIPAVYEWYDSFNRAHGMIMSAFKFAILSTSGEVIGLRIQKGVYWEKGFGILPRAMVWAVLGMGIKMAMVIFSNGTPQFLAYIGFSSAPAALSASALTWEKALTAFCVSVSMNAIFAPIFMTLHKITDMHILGTGGTLKGFFSHPIRMGQLLQNINWERQWGFVFKKTIPLFWFPAHTVTFILPEQHQALSAALLGVVLGIFMSMAGGKPKKEGTV